MKRLSPSSRSPRFSGGMRHYHRSGTPLSSWEQWIDGEGRPTRRPWLKILGILVVLLALGGIIAGLIIVLNGL